MAGKVEVILNSQSRSHFPVAESGTLSDWPTVFISHYLPPGSQSKRVPRVIGRIFKRILGETERKGTEEDAVQEEAEDSVRQPFLTVSRIIQTEKRENYLILTLMVFILNRKVKKVVWKRVN